MKSLLSFFLINILINSLLPAQIIPYGTSQDSATLIVSNNYGSKDTLKYEIFYYKPLNYDPITSPVLLAIHGSGGNGGSEIGDLQTTADRRNALIVAPTVDSWTSQNGFVVSLGHVDSCSAGCSNVHWMPLVFREIYHHVLLRENRSSIPVYIIGFSAGGQLVTRYMLIRQVVSDFIPIRMAVSVSPFYYTFCTDTLNGWNMPFPSGLSYTDSYSMMPKFISCDSICDYYQGLADSCCFLYNYALNNICNEHVIQYYNENYAVLVGDLDTASGGSQCIAAQGNSRYSRAKNFFFFSDSDAVVQGTTLNWKYGEVPGAGHNQNLLYNIAISGDSISIAERLLFETPYHSVPSLAPEAFFEADSIIVSLPNATVQFFNNSINADSYEWSFGDGDSSYEENPSHTYQYADTFNVTLTAISSSGCSNRSFKNEYIIVKNGVSVNSLNHSQGNLQIFPNPSDGQITIRIGNENIRVIEIYSCLGNKTIEINLRGNESTYIFNADNLNGLYIIKVKTKENVYFEKIVFE